MYFALHTHTHTYRVHTYTGHCCQYSECFMKNVMNCVGQSHFAALQCLLLLLGCPSLLSWTLLLPQKKKVT